VRRVKVGDQGRVNEGYGGHDCNSANACADHKGSVASKAWPGSRQVAKV